MHADLPKGKSLLVHMIIGLSVPEQPTRHPKQRAATRRRHEISSDKLRSTPSIKADVDLMAAANDIVDSITRVIVGES